MSETKRIARVFNRLLERASRLNYGLAKRHYFSKQEKEYRGLSNPPLLVYQMGKVGSSTAVATLNTVDLDAPIYHVHFLSPDLVEKYEAKRRPYLRTRKAGDLKHIWQYQFIRKLLNDPGRSGKWRVISLVRDPVARNLATFFEHIEVQAEDGDCWDLKSWEYQFETRVCREDQERLIELFYEKCRHDTPLVYFDREFRDVLGFDIFETGFPVKRGYQITRRDNADFLVIRLEDLNRCATQAFSEFLGVDGLRLVNRNVGGGKEYAEIYDRFKRIIKLPPDYLDRMYDSKFARHFYTEAEIAEFRKRWTRS
ncbi:MAG: putative capsular polysaccharide synthesis family protein [Pseudomonadota bacterium]|nr:putative capsular polysaccharide synthesis family protein [Pseudomonadota bacterium]